MGMSQQHALTAQKVNSILGCIKKKKKKKASRLREVKLPFCSVLVRPHLDYHIQMRSPQYRRDVDLLECIQKRSAKMAQRIEYLPR